VQERLREAHIEPFLLPPQSAKLTFPYDHPFFSSLKARMHTMDTSTTAAKQSAFLQAYQEYSLETVKASLVRCGWDI
jgi:hypothetical protein